MLAIQIVRTQSNEVKRLKRLHWMQCILIQIKPWLVLSAFSGRELLLADLRWSKVSANHDYQLINWNSNAKNRKHNNSFSVRILTFKKILNQNYAALSSAWCPIHLKALWNSISKSSSINAFWGVSCSEIREQAICGLWIGDFGWRTSKRWRLCHSDCTSIARIDRRGSWSRCVQFKLIHFL